MRAQAWHISFRNFGNFSPIIRYLWQWSNVQTVFTQAPLLPGRDCSLRLHSGLLLHSDPHNLQTCGTWFGETRGLGMAHCTCVERTGMSDVIWWYAFRSVASASRWYTVLKKNKKTLLFSLIHMYKEEWWWSSFVSQLIYFQIFVWRIKFLDCWQRNYGDGSCPPNADTKLLKSMFFKWKELAERFSIPYFLVAGESLRVPHYLCRVVITRSKRENY